MRNISNYQRAVILYLQPIYCFDTFSDLGTDSSVCVNCRTSFVPQQGKKQQIILQPAHNLLLLYLKKKNNLYIFTCPLRFLFTHQVNQHILGLDLKKPHKKLQMGNCS